MQAIFSIELWKHSVQLELGTKCTVINKIAQQLYSSGQAWQGNGDMEATLTFTVCWAGYRDCLWRGEMLKHIHLPEFGWPVCSLSALSREGDVQSVTPFFLENYFLPFP